MNQRSDRLRNYFLPYFRSYLNGAGTSAELIHLYFCYLASDQKNILELGVENGVNLCALGGLPEEEYGLYGVDDFGNPFYSLEKMQQGVKMLQEAYAHFVGELEILDRINIICSRTDDPNLKGQLEGREYSLIFIDADHRYESVRLDIQLVESLLSSGGLLVFDDHFFEWEDVSYGDKGVGRAVDEWLVGNNDYGIIHRFNHRLCVAHRNNIPGYRLKFEGFKDAIFNFSEVEERDRGEFYYKHPDRPLKFNMAKIRPKFDDDAWGEAFGPLLEHP